MKGSTKKLNSKEGGFLNFLRPLMTTALPLMKNVLTPLAKSVLVPLGVTPVTLEADAAIQNKIRYDCTYSFKQRNGWYH